LSCGQFLRISHPVLPQPDCPRSAVERAARHGYGRLLAYLVAHTRDVAGAEDALSEAFTSALTVWPTTGIPASPQAWLLAVARRKAIDAARRRQTRESATDPLRMLFAEASEAAATTVPDERLRLMFACAHPAIDASIRAPLILQTVLGFDAEAIAIAFLVAPSTMSQRLVRAKNKIRNAGIPFRVPDADELSERLEAVLDAVYSAFTAGWSDPALAEEAIWLGELIVTLLPDEPEATGLQALMLHVEARRMARRADDGAYVPLDKQDVNAWRGELIAQAETLLLRAGRMQRPGRFQLEAAIQSVHAARRRSGITDWHAVVALYDALLQRTASPVVAVNRAVALAALRGADTGLAALDLAASDARLLGYQPYWAARAALLGRCGQVADAMTAYDRAISLTSDQAEQQFLRMRQAELNSDNTRSIAT
jgi:RNA polymerase sigma-70 factor, ECF subfamily